MMANKEDVASCMLQVASCMLHVTVLRPFKLD